MFWTGAACAALCSACGISLREISTEDIVVSVPSLVGEWRKVQSTSTAVVSPDGANRYQITYTDDEHRVARFSARLVAIGGDTVLDAIPDESLDEILNDHLLAHLLPLHGFSRVRLSGDRLLIWATNPDTLRAFVRRHPAAVRHAFLEDGVILTDSARALQAFFAGYSRQAGAFGDSSEWRRVAARVACQDAAAEDSVTVPALPAYTGIRVAGSLWILKRIGDSAVALSQVALHGLDTVANAYLRPSTAPERHQQLALLAPGRPMAIVPGAGPSTRVELRLGAISGGEPRIAAWQCADSLPSSRQALQRVPPPELVEPAGEVSLSATTTPLKVRFTWRAVRGADAYDVAVGLCQHACSWLRLVPTRDTTLAYDFGGAPVGQWRVRAHVPGLGLGPFSELRRFHWR